MEKGLNTKELEAKCKAIELRKKWAFFFGIILLLGFFMGFGYAFSMIMIHLNDLSKLGAGFVISIIVGISCIVVILLNKQIARVLE